MSDSLLSASRVDRVQIAELARPESEAVVSLEGRLIDSFARAAVGTEGEQARINAMLERPDITNPEVLARLQELTAQYNVDVSLLNALVRKTVTAAETLLRSS